jgi:hypothetical protein
MHTLAAKSNLNPRQSRKAFRLATRLKPVRSTPKPMTSEDQTNTPAAHLSRSEIQEIAGNIEDAKVSAIERSGATVEQLEEAVAWASGLSGVMSKERRPLSGTVAQLYEILTADEDFGDERE